MKKGILLFGLALSILWSCGPKKDNTDNGTAGNDSTAYAGPPYTVELEECIVPGMPGLHSYTHAIYTDKIIMFGGRINGLHGQSYNFNRSNSNDSIYVVDTHNWGPETAWTVYRIHYSKIKFTAEPHPALDLSQFHANNAEFFTQNANLYVIGGLLGGT